jgi:hypothetical protein
MPSSYTTRFLNRLIASCPPSHHPSRNCNKSSCILRRRWNLTGVAFSRYDCTGQYNRCYQIKAMMTSATTTGLFLLCPRNTKHLVDLLTARPYVELLETVHRLSINFSRPPFSADGAIGRTLLPQTGNSPSEREYGPYFIQLALALDAAVFRFAQIDRLLSPAFN